MKNKKVWLGIATLLAVIGLLAGVYAGNRPKTTQGEKQFTVTVVHGDGSQKEFSYATDEEYLGPVLLEEGLIEGSDSEYGLMISAVDGETADWTVNQSYWALYVGEEYAVTGIDTTPVTNGESYSLVYTLG